MVGDGIVEVEVAGLVVVAETGGWRAGSWEIGWLRRGDINIWFAVCFELTLAVVGKICPLEAVLVVLIIDRAVFGVVVNHTLCCLVDCVCWGFCHLSWRGASFPVTSEHSKCPEKW
jgi:hypothetical protein